MSKHIWLIDRPQKETIEQIRKAFEAAISEGLAPLTAVAFSGYWAETLRQKGGFPFGWSWGGERKPRPTPTNKIRASKTRGFIFARRKEYLIPFLKFLPLLVPEIEQFDTLEIVSDYLEERGKTKDAFLLRAAAEAAIALGVDPCLPLRLPEARSLGQVLGSSRSTESRPRSV